MKKVLLLNKSDVMQLTGKSCISIEVLISVLVNE